MGCYPSGQNKEIKLKRAKRGEINCGRCPYHKKENANKHPKEDKYKEHRRK